DRVEAVGRHVIRKAARAADAANEYRFLARDAEVRHGALDGLQHGIVATARAPADLLVARPVLGGGDGGHFVHECGLSQMMTKTTAISRSSIGQTLSCFIRNAPNAALLRARTRVRR